MTNRTKWSILMDRLNEAQSVVDQLTRQMEGLNNTRCGLNCTGCGKLLETEGDFARHFIVRDSRYLNLGECPVREAAKKAAALNKEGGVIDVPAGQGEATGDALIATAEQQVREYMEDSFETAHKQSMSACPEGNDECAADNPCSDNCHQRYIMLASYNRSKKD